MASWALPEGYVSFRYVILKYGMNYRHVETLVLNGTLVSNGKGILEASTSRLVEGRDYVVCRECGAWAGAIMPKHVRACANMSFEEYAAKHGADALACTVVSDRRAKTEAEKQYQSKVLTARFATAEGEVTKAQISAASKRMMESGYRAQASEHLRKLNQQPAVRRRLSRESKERWADGSMRKKVTRWHRENSELSQELAAKARKSITQTFTRPHQELEKLLVDAGLPVKREYEVGYYRVDEALPDELVAVEMDGCYWHGCDSCGFPGCDANRALDRRKTTYLKRLGWCVIRIKECDLKADPAKCVKRVVKAFGRVCDRQAS